MDLALERRVPDRFHLRWRRLSLGALSLGLGLLAGYSFSVALLGAGSRFIPSTWPGALVLGLATLTACGATWAVLRSWRRAACGGWRALVLVAPAAGALLVILPPSACEIKWMHGVGLERGKTARVFAAASWGSTCDAFELHASDAPDDPDTRWSWWAGADLSGLRQNQSHQLELRITQPENSVFDRGTGAALTGSDGLRAEILAIRGGARTSLRELCLTPQADAQQRRWWHLTVPIPHATERLVLEVRSGPPGSTNWFDRLWVHSVGITPVLLGAGGSTVATAARFFAACWLAWVLVCILQLIDAAISRARTGPRIARAACALRRALRGYWPSLVVAGAVVIVYLPVVRADYGKLDDYWFLWASNTDPTQITSHNWGYGRFLAAPLHRWAFESITTISEVRWVRGLSVLGLAGFAAAFVALLRVRGWPPLIGAALALLVCMTPSAQSTVGLATSVHRPFAALCALASAGAVMHAAAGRSARQRVTWLIAAMVALVCAFFFQQSWAMFYVPCCFVAVFRADRETTEPHRLRLVGLQAATLLVALAVAAIATRCVAEPMERTSLSQGPWTKLVWFVKEPLVNAGAVFQITPSHAGVLLVAALIATGCVAYLWQRRGSAAASLIWGVTLLPVAYLPNLLTAESWASYRSIGPLSALVLLLVALAVLGLAHVGFRSPRVPATALLVGLAGWSCIVARTNVLTHIVAEQVAERDLFRAQLLKAEGRNVAAVHIIQPTYEYWPRGVHRYDDFGVPSSFAAWCPEPMFHLISAELPNPLAQKLAGVPVTWGVEPKDGGDSELLQIDMRLLSDFNRYDSQWGFSRSVFNTKLPGTAGLPNPDSLKFAPNQVIAGDVHRRESDTAP